MIKCLPALYFIGFVFNCAIKICFVGDLHVNDCDELDIIDIHSDESHINQGNTLHIVPCNNEHGIGNANTFIALNAIDNININMNDHNVLSRLSYLIQTLLEIQSFTPAHNDTEKYNIEFKVLKKSQFSTKMYVE